MISLKNNVQGSQDRWATRNKITQLERINNLIVKDKQMLKISTSVEMKQQKKEIKDLKGAIFNCRKDLFNAKTGNMQALTRSLIHRKELLLAFQNSHPNKLLDHLLQDNFKKRKTLDLHVNKRREKYNTLLNLKKEKIRLEKMYVTCENPKFKEKVRHLTGQIHDMYLKNNAAFSLSRLYKNILEIMRKDAYCFNKLIALMNKEIRAQVYRMFYAVKLGQLATEYLDDKRQYYLDYKRLSKLELRKTRTLVKIYNFEVDEMARKLEHIVELNTHSEGIKGSKCAIRRRNAEVQFQLDYRIVKKTLECLRDKMMLTNFQSCLPALAERQNQHFRLQQLVKKYKKKRDFLKKQKNNLETVYVRIIDRRTKQDETEKNKMQKQFIINDIEKEKEKQEEMVKNVYTDIIFIARIEEAINELNRKFYVEHDWDGVSEDVSFTFSAFSNTAADVLNNLTVLEENVDKLIKIMNRQKLNEDESQKAKHVYLTNIQKNYQRIHEKYESILPPIDRYVPPIRIPTRRDIKDQSRKIVDANVKRGSI